MSKTFKTPKGTELPIRDMHGKDYLDVPDRVLWMREEHQDWSIETEILTASPEEAVVRATVRNEQGRILAQGTKRSTVQEFKRGHIEKAETGAIGRALGFAGYGTQFAVDLDEPEEDGSENPVVSESPIEKPKGLKAVQGGKSDANTKECAGCGGKMIVSKYPDKVTGKFDWYCLSCKAREPREEPKAVGGRGPK